MISGISFTRVYFNTAAMLVVSTVLSWSPSIQAQQSNSEVLCRDTFSVEPSTALTRTVHFVPSNPDYDDVRKQLKDSLLPIMPADETRIWHLGSRILTQLPTDWDLSNAAQQYFLITRSKAIKTSTYRPALGQFIETIGLARVEPSAKAPTVALKIITARREVTAGDQLIAAHCLPHAITDISNTDHGIAVDATIEVSPKIVAFLDENTIGSRDSVVLIDKGLKDGIAVGQTWELIDQLPNQPASAQPFGQAKVIQSFTDVSVLRIGNVAHEARLQTTLRRSQP